MKNDLNSRRGMFPWVALLLLLTWPCGVGAVTSLKIDLTAGTNRFSMDRTWTYNLGATGMHGWIDNGWPEAPDVAEVLGYSRTLTASEEASVGGYLAAKYGIRTAYNR